MKTLLLGAAMLGALIAPACAQGELVCSIRDNYGNNLTYAFADNSSNADGTFGGTMVETGFDKNGRSTFSQVGRRPIWVYGSNQGGGFNLYSREAPGWTIGWVAGPSGAVLMHNNRIVGRGACEGSSGTQASIGDLGN